jgi:hypothetical protein
MSKKKQPGRTTVVNVRGREDLTGVIYVGRRMRFGRFAKIAEAHLFEFGNPFKVTEDSLAEVLEKYRQHILARPDLLALLPSLRGKALGCWCCDGDADNPNPRLCHAQVLAELADGPLGQ